MLKAGLGQGEPHPLFSSTHLLGVEHMPSKPRPKPQALPPSPAPSPAPTQAPPLRLHQERLEDGPVTRPLRRTSRNSSLTAETEQACPWMLLEAAGIQVWRIWGIPVDTGGLGKKPAQKTARCEEEKSRALPRHLTSPEVAFPFASGCLWLHPKPPQN